jgi:small conductance mechanosensitive channel
MFTSLMGENFISLVLLPLLLNVAIAIGIMVVGWAITKLIVRGIERYLTKARTDELLVTFATTVANVTLSLTVIIAALSSLGINTTSLIALLGAAGLAVGLALQDSLQNFASGVMLMLQRPFTTGDFVEAAGTAGVVEEVSLFTSILHTSDNRKVIVPNSEIYDGIITNYSAHATRRIDMIFGIGYDDDIRKARQIMQEILENDERVLKEPEPAVAVEELADSSVNFHVRPWVKAEDYGGVKSSVTEKIKLAFDENGISIPYPQMDVHVGGEGSGNQE